MNQEIKKLWVAALRSNKYEQAQGQLFRGVDGETGIVHCCGLGVLNDLHAKNTGDGWWVGDGYQTDSDPTIEAELLHPAVAAWAELSSRDPEVRADYGDAGGEGTVSELNDTYGWDFDDLAYIIDKCL